VNYPVDKTTPISSRFGFRWKPKKGWHSGLDWAVSLGTPIKACYKGLVVNTGNWGNYGLIVELEHPTMGKIWSLYAHLSKIEVEVGQVTEKGQVIGYSGSTGWSTGPHLHFELRVGINRIGFAVNPERHLKCG
jgi:murein DD-endopeptidase MepM/ murein hydrolase activator NlpD